MSPTSSVQVRSRSHSPPAIAIAIAISQTQSRASNQIDDGPEVELPSSASPSLPSSTHPTLFLPLSPLLQTTTHPPWIPPTKPSSPPPMDLPTQNADSHIPPFFDLPPPYLPPAPPFAPSPDAFLDSPSLPSDFNTSRRALEPAACKDSALSDGAGDENQTGPSRSPSPSSSSPSAHRALLDKPLEELTEEDIMQLTREDCRRYLKEKGMRRPSWNKSQAIQQVLSLKGLFDDCKNENEGGLRKFPKEPALIQKPVTLQEKGLVDTGAQETFVNAPRMSEKHGQSDLQNSYQPHISYPMVSTPVDSEIFIRGAHPDVPPSKSTISVTLEQLGKKSTCPENSCAQCVGMSTRQQSAQLTIFYSGMVNVYDNVSADKAQAIMLLAASGDAVTNPPCLHTADKMTSPITVTGAYVTGPPTSSMACPHTTTQTALVTSSPAVSVSISQSARAVNTEPPQSREASVQRFLEKRRERSRLRAP